MELFIVFQFFNDLFSTKGKKIVATAVGFGFYAVAYAAFLFVNSTVVNILLCFVIDSVFAKLFFKCNIKGATLGALLGITDALGGAISECSHGMKQKIAIISALIHKPKLILMDEPFVGLDPVASHQLKT